MARFRSRSFAVRLAAAFAGVGIAAAALTAILVNLAFGGRLSGYLEAQRTARQDQLVSALADSYREAGRWDPDDLERLAPLAMMDGGILTVQDALGQTVWEPTEGSLGERMARMHRQMMTMGPLGPERRLPIAVDGLVAGYAVSRMPEAGLLPQDEAFRDSVNRLLLVGGIAAGTVALLLGVILSRKATAPARDLTAVARAQAGGHRERRAEVRSGDEFAEMALAFNAMADAVVEEDRLRRAFAADVAHELRTPLAILQSQVEAIQDEIVRPDSATLASLHDEILRVSRLVSDLETMAAVDAAAFDLKTGRVDLGRALAETIAGFAGPFEAQGIRLETELAVVTVVGDRLRLQQLAANLVSNAMKFTPPGGTVRLTLRQDGPDAQLEVEDTGLGIPPDELPFVFDRFFRGREARARGSGIGLAVVRELAEAHGGSVRVASEPGVGTTFTVRIPTAAVAAEPSTAGRI